MAHPALLRVLQRNLKQALQQGHLETAAELLRQLKDDDPLSVATRGLELEVLMARRRWPEAAALAEQLLRLFPASARIQYLAGRIAYQRKDYTAALVHFAEAYRIHPHWSVRRWLGKTQTQRGDYVEAEGLLVGLLAEHPAVGLDLAWLHERRGAPERALRCLQEYLAWRPEDRFAQAQRLRLRASSAAPEELVREVEALEELGEDIAPEVLPAYVQRLLETGRSAEARQFVVEREGQWPPEVAGRVAWVCHRLQAYDLALALFVAGLPAHPNDFKYLSALEAAARRCARVDQVAAAYQALAPEHRHLYGRLKALQRRST